MRLTIVILFIAWYLVSVCQSQATAKCSVSSPCAQGCCNIDQTCGFGPAFCAPSVCNATASVNGTCAQKSECDPGVYPGYGDVWGPEYAAVTICPLHACCSPYGFCGTTSDFCGNTTATSQPQCSTPNSSANRTVGYWDASNLARPCDTMVPENIPIESYTHINFAFASIDPKTYNVTPAAPDQTSLYTRFTGLKKKQPGLKTWISIGNWAVTNPGPAQNTFSRLVASSSAKTGFYVSLIGFMKEYDFDGVDIYWDHPGVVDQGGSVTDFPGYVAFLEGLKSALEVAGDFGLSISIPSRYSLMKNFDIVTIAQVVDWVNVMAYDLHGSWDKNETSVGPFVYADSNLTEIETDMELLWRNNIDPAKLNLGIGFYGRGYTLSNNNCTASGCPFSGGSYPGACTQTPGLLSYNEIVSYIQSSGAKVSLDQNAAAQIATWNSNQWIAYDSPQTLQMKLNYANGRCIGGTAAWAIDLDVGGVLSYALSNTTAGKTAVSSSASHPPSASPTNTPVNPLSTRVYSASNSKAFSGVVSDIGTATNVLTGSMKNASSAAATNLVIVTATDVQIMTFINVVGATTSAKQRPSSTPTGGDGGVSGTAFGNTQLRSGTSTPLNPTTTRLYWSHNSTKATVGTIRAASSTYSMPSGAAARPGADSVLGVSNSQESLGRQSPGASPTGSWSKTESNTRTTTSASSNNFSAVTKAPAGSSTSYVTTYYETVLLPSDIPASMYASSGYNGPRGSTIPSTASSSGNGSIPNHTSISSHSEAPTSSQSSSKFSSGTSRPGSSTGGFATHSSSSISNSESHSMTRKSTRQTMTTSHPPPAPKYTGPPLAELVMCWIQTGADAPTSKAPSSYAWLSGAQGDPNCADLTQIANPESKETPTTSQESSVNHLPQGYNNLSNLYGYGGCAYINDVVPDDNYPKLNQGDSAGTISCTNPKDGFCLGGACTKDYATTFEKVSGYRFDQMLSCDMVAIACGAP